MTARRRRVFAAFVPAFALLAIAPAATRSGSASPSGLVLQTRQFPGVSTLVYVARIDPTRTSLALYPGTTQPPIALPRGPASVPHRERWRLVAAFNGGFKYTYIGLENGFAVNGHTYVWLKRGLGTLIGYRDGRVDVRAWRGGPSPPRDVVFARQNLPLVVEGGRAAPALADWPRWGATLGNVPAVWRTGVGVDGHGDLVYVAAADLTARGLASILIRAGAVRAIELDINPEWPTFIVYAHAHGLRPRMFVPNLQQSATRYLTPDKRDFFVVYRRTGAAATVPFG